MKIKFSLSNLFQNFVNIIQISQNKLLGLDCTTGAASRVQVVG